MGFFDKLFGGKAASETKFSGQKMTVMLPIDGKVIPLEQLPDETFASAILGPGCGVEPTGDTVYAPFDGTVTQVPESLHAVGMMSDDGIELLIHVGMDTVEMKGQGFTSLTKEGAKVKAGTPLLKVDLEAIRAAGHPTATALIVTNSDDLPEISVQVQEISEQIPRRQSAFGGFLRRKVVLICKKCCILRDFLLHCRGSCARVGKV